MSMTSGTERLPAETGSIDPERAEQGVLARSGVAAQSEWRRRWRRFSSYRPALGALVILAVLVFIAVFAPLVAPHDPLRHERPASR